VAKSETFNDLFLRATGRAPFPYQERLAGTESPRVFVNVPTGVGKTASAFFAWLWRRRFAPQSVQQQTPRRLVYCLPMRVLVEQTRNHIVDWVGRLGLKDQIGVHALMGGEESGDWDLYPECDLVLTGTQDMLLSRALNRGYGMSRYRWPMEYGLLNNDCLWVLDEVQLMGNGLATTTQLQAFREKLGTLGPAHTIWMSATLDRDWLIEFRIIYLQRKQPRLLPESHHQGWALAHPLERATSMDAQLGEGARAEVG
jgi:CRISPR-associated endonuclease/helicase Cas3